ncbi:MAG: DUF4381 domain-containing protein [Halioglobus sp.]
MIRTLLPSLPDTFGNYALGDFAELAAPESISWWPSTIGWRVLVLILAVVAASAVWNAGKRWHANRYRREAQHKLQLLKASPSPEHFLHELNKLLKLTAIVGYSREEVAALSGASWAEFLNAECESPPFTAEQAQWLAEGPYRADALDTQEYAALTAASAAWINAHRGRPDA